MVRLEELEDEHFINKPKATADGALLADDDEDYTDTGMFIHIPYLCPGKSQSGSRRNTSVHQCDPSSAPQGD